MKKVLHQLMAIIFFAAMISFNGCDKDSTIIPENSDNTAKKRSKSIASASDVLDGGFECCSHDGLTFYIVTVKSVIFANPSTANRYPGGMVGATFVSPNIPGMVFPSDVCRGIVPLGTYEFWISTRKFNEDQIYTYSIPVTVTISNSLKWPLPWVYTGAEGWTRFCTQPGGTWIAGRPQTWPKPTIPYGSGSLQATLTWNNTHTNATDLDLHLYGPNGIHIYFGSQTSSDFELDRDWMTTVGNATENIYSLKKVLPKGNYTVKVVNFTGETKNFTARVIVNGVVTNYSGTLTGEDATVTVKTFTIK
jgi:hypothetical protein